MLVFYLGFICYIPYGLLDRTMFVEVFATPVHAVMLACKAAALAFFALRLVLMRYTHEQFLVLCALGLLCVVSFRMTASWVPVWLFLFVSGGRGANVRVLAGISLAISAVVLMATVAAGVVGLLPSVVFPGRGAFATRTSLGFIHPNSLGFVCFSCAVSFMTLMRGRPALHWLPLVLLLFCITTFVADSRTMTIAFVLLFLFALFERVPDDRKRLLRIGYLVAFLLMVCASIYYMYFFSWSSGFDVGLNEYLSRRLSYANAYTSLYPVTPLGRNFLAGLVGPNLGSLLPVIDNVYAYFLLQFGLVPSLLVLGVMCALFVRGIHGRVDSLELKNIAMFCIVGFSETICLRIDCNFFLVAVSDVLFGPEPVRAPSSQRATHLAAAAITDTHMRGAEYGF